MAEPADQRGDGGVVVRQGIRCLMWLFTVEGVEAVGASLAG